MVMDPVNQPGLEHFSMWVCDIHNSGQCVWVLYHLHSKDFLPNPLSKPTLFQLRAIPPCPVSTCPSQKSLSSFFLSPLVLGAPGLDAALWVGCHQSRVGDQNPLLHPAAHTVLNAALDTLSFLGCEPGSCCASCPPAPPSPSSQSCSHSILHLACTCVWDCSDPYVGPCTWSWTSGFSKFT